MPNATSTSNNPLFAVLAFIFIGPWKLREHAYTRVLSAICPPYEILCLAFSIIAARSGSHGFNFWTFFFLEVLGFPILWLIFAKPFTTLWEKFGGNLTRASDKYLGEPLKYIAETIARTPGTAWLWKQSSSSTVIVGLVSGVLILSAAAGSLYTGWLVKLWLEPHLWDFVAAYTQDGVVHTIVTFVSYLLALNVAALIGTVLVGVTINSQNKGNGLIASFGIAIGTSHYLNEWTASYGSPYVTYGAIALAAAVINLWLYPLLVYLASNGLLKAIAKALGPVFDNFYSAPSKEKDVAKAYRDLFQQSTNIAMTAYLGGNCYAILSGFGLNVFLLGASTLFFGAFVYCLGGVALNHRWGNGVCNAVYAGAVGFATFFHTEFISSSVGGYGAIILGVIAAVVNFGLVVPLLYAGVGYVLSAPVLNLITELGTGLRVAHKFINENTFDRVYRASLIIYHECYRSDTPSELSYEHVVLHLTNMALALTLGALAYLGLHAGVTTWLLVDVPLSVVVFVLAYSLLGHAVIEGEAPLAGAFAALLAMGGAAAYLTPNHVFDLQYSLLVAGVLGVLVFAFFYPVFYALVRYAAGDWFSGWQKPLDKMLDSATQAVAEPLLAGWRSVVAAWHIMTEAFNSVFGRKSKTPSQEV